MAIGECDLFPDERRVPCTLSAIQWKMYEKFDWIPIGCKSMCIAKWCLAVSNDKNCNVKTWRNANKMSYKLTIYFASDFVFFGCNFSATGKRKSLPSDAAIDINGKLSEIRDNNCDSDITNSVDHSLSDHGNWRDSLFSCVFAAGNRRKLPKSSASSLTR